MGSKSRAKIDPDTDRMFRRLMEQKEEHDRVYTRVKDEEMFTWFHCEALPILKRYAGFTSKLSYEEKENGITVTFIAKELLLLPDMESYLMEILARCSRCSIDPTEDRKLSISLWFRGWKEVKKPCSSSREELQ